MAVCAGDAALHCLRTGREPVRTWRGRLLARDGGAAGRPATVSGHSSTGRGLRPLRRNATTSTPRSISMGAWRAPLLVLALLLLVLALLLLELRLLFGLLLFELGLLFDLLLLALGVLLHLFR